MFVSGGHQSEFTSQQYRWRSQRPIIAAGPQVLRGGCIFLPAPCSNLLPRSLVVFHLHSGSCCFISLHFLSWLDLEAGHVAETLAGQKEGNQFLFHHSGNLSSPGVWGQVRIFSLQGERQLQVGSPILQEKHTLISKACSSAYLGNLNQEHCQVQGLPWL